MRKETRRKANGVKTVAKVTYAPDELARALGVARNTVYVALRNGVIPHVRMGSRFVIPKAAIDTWFATIGQKTLQVAGKREEGRKL